MPKNTIGGKKHKKNKNQKMDVNVKKGPIQYAEKNQVYATVVKRLGGSRLLIHCSDGKQRNAIISGKFKRRLWMNVGDTLLCDLGTTGKDNECTIVLKYSPVEATALKAKGLIDFGEYEVENKGNTLEFTDETVNEIKEQVVPSFDGLPSDSDSEDTIDLDDL